MKGKFDVVKNDIPKNQEKTKAIKRLSGSVMWYLIDD